MAVTFLIAIESILKAHMNMKIRIAVASDAVAACNVLRRSIAECCLLDHKNDPVILGAWLGNKTPEMVANWFTSTSNFSVVAFEADTLVGVALMTRAGKLQLCYLLPEALNRGIGLAMLKRIEAEALEWGVKSLQMHSTSTAAAFCERQGFIRSDQMISSYGVETTFFWKPLGPNADVTRTRFCNCNVGSE
jgi:GNAT superfamily N-acetyltransferase